jgi:hypothetical protein
MAAEIGPSLDLSKVTICHISSLDEPYATRKPAANATSFKSCSPRPISSLSRFSAFFAFSAVKVQIFSQLLRTYMRSALATAEMQAVLK